jgi:hypothetical protein
MNNKRKREKKLNKQEKKKHNTCKGAPIEVLVDFSPETFKDRTEFYNIFIAQKAKKIKNKNIAN